MTTRVLLVANTGTFVGGGQASLLGLVDHLDRDRFEPYVVCPEEGDFSEALLERGIPTLVRRMPSFRGPSVLRVPFAMSSWLDLVRRYEIELMHADGTRAMMHAGPVGKLASVPVLWHVRVLGTDGLLDRALARIATRVVVNSHAVARRFDFLEASSRGPCVIHNGVDLDAFTHARPDPALRRQWRLEGKLVLALLRARGVDATLILVGDEVPSSRGERARLEDIAKRRQVQDHCVFAGFRRDVPQILKQADLLLHTACNEPFGRALIEAMASSLAVVASGGGGVEEVVRDGVTGVVVRSDSPEVWAQTIARLYRDRRLRRQMGAAGRRRAEDYFSLESHVAGVERLYEEVLSSTQ
jgi:hypothetical protein